MTLAAGAAATTARLAGRCTVRQLDVLDEAQKAEWQGACADAQPDVVFVNNFHGWETVMPTVSASLLDALNRTSRNERMLRVLTLHPCAVLKEAAKAAGGGGYREWAAPPASFTFNVAKETPVHVYELRVLPPFPRAPPRLLVTLPSGSGS